MWLKIFLHEKSFDTALYGNHDLLLKNKKICKKIIITNYWWIHESFSDFLKGFEP